MANYNLAFPDLAIDAILTTAYDLQNAGYIFKGSATSWSGTPTQRTWLLAPAGFIGYGFSSAIPKGSIGICRWTGSAWSGDVINVVTIDSTVTNGSTNPVSGDAVWDALDELATGIRDTLLSFTITDGTASADQASKLTYDVKMTDGQGGQHLIDSFNILAATAYKAGLMTAADKAKVDSFLSILRSMTFAETTAGADVGTKIVETLKMTVNGVQEAVTALTILAATTSKAGLMSATDKAYIDELPSSLTSINADISKLLAMLGYYECSTAAGTAAKTVSASGYVLTNGGCIRIKMTNANTANNVTLNINSTGAKALYYDGAQASSSNTWEAGEVLEVYYDGTQYQCASGGGGKFATGEKVKETGITDNVVNGSNDLITSGGVYSTLNGDVIENIVATLNGFYNNGSVTSSTSYSHTQPITLKIGDVLTVQTAGRGFDVFTKEVSGVYTRLLNVSSGDDNTLQTFTYTAQEEINIAVTTKNSPTPSISVNRGRLLRAGNVSYSSVYDPSIENVDEALRKIEDNFGGNKTIPLTYDGFYYNGTPRSSSSYKYTSLISMKAGDVLTVQTAGQGFDVLTKEDNGQYSTLLYVSSGSDNVLQTFTYTAQADINIIVTAKNSPTPSITLTLAGIMQASNIKFDPSRTLLEEDDVQGAIEGLSQEIYGDITHIQPASGGFYINGTYYSSSNYSVSNKIHLNVGDKIVVTTAGNGFDVLTNATTEGSYRTLMNVPASPGFDTTLVEYTYTADRVLDVIVTTKNSPTPSAYREVRESVGIGDKLSSFGTYFDLTPVWQRKKFISCFHLDCGRKYFSPANIKLMIDYLEAAGVDIMELHFSEDEGFRFALDDMNIVANGTTYDLSVSLGEGVNRLGSGDGSGKYLTQSEMDGIITYAKAHNVEIAPSFDMPGHMGCILKDFPQFKYNTYSVNFMNDEAVNFAFAIADKYARYFASRGCHIYNICADEVGSFTTMHETGQITYFAKFVNDLIRLVSSHGFIPQIFNDCLYYGGNPTPIINRSVDVLYYYEGGSGNPFGSVADVMDDGYNYMINSSNSIYYILGKGSVSVQTMLAFDPHLFKGNATVLHPHGAMFCAWCDVGNADGQDDGNAMTARMQELIDAFGQALVSHMRDNERPVSPSVGNVFFDKKLKQPIWYSDSGWIDALGNSLP